MNDKKKANAQIWITFQVTVTNKFPFKIKNEDNHNTLRFGNEYLLSTLEKLQIQTKYNSNRVIDYQEQPNSLLWLKTTLATLSNQETTIQLRYFLQRRTENDSTNTQKHLQFFCTMEAEYQKGNGSQTKIYWLQTAKLMNRTEKNEHRNQNWGTMPSLITAPVTQWTWNAVHLLHSGSALNFRFTEQSLRWARDETLLGFRVTVCSSIQGFWPSKW